MKTARRFEDDPDLWGVVDAAGLNPKGRARNFTFDCPDCGRKGKASGRRDGPWHCFACDAKGNALTLARRFDLAGADLRPTAPPPATDNRKGVAPSTARAAWAALEGQRDAYRERLALYLAEVRGWPAELAEAGARVAGWAWIPADCPEMPRPLAWIGRDADRRAAFALRDERGEVWTLERRWTATTPPANPETTPKALRMRTRSEEAGRLAIFGRVPDAVAAADRGEPIYLCEGGPDYLAAAALCRLDGRGAALGAHGHAGLPKVAAALRAALAAAAVPVSRVHALCVPHLGDKLPKGAPPEEKRGVGELSMLAAADVLAGAGAVSVVRVPVDGAGKGDLADAARTGAGELRALAQSAGVWTARHYAEGEGRAVAPTDMHPVVLPVLDAAGLRGTVKRGPAGGVTEFVLSRCPACGETRGECYLTPTGRLKSHRERDCPASPTRTGNHGIDLAEWVDLYAPEGAAGFATPAPSPDPSQEVNAGAAELPDALDVRDPAAALDVADLEEALRAAGPNDVTLFATPPGVGKSEAALQLAAKVAEGGARALYLGANHTLAAELAARLRVLSPGIEPVHLRGMAGLCKLPERDPPHAPAIARAAETMGRRMCEGCPLASRENGGTCEGWAPPRVRRGSATFAAHAHASLVNRLDERDPDDSQYDAADLVIVDELPDLVRVRETGPAHLETLVRVGLTRDVRRWYAANPGHAALAHEILAVADALDAETHRGVYAERRAVGDVLDALRARPAAMAAARAVLAEGADVLDALPPMPTPADARRGTADRWPDAGAWIFVRAVARALSDPAAAPAATVLRLDAGAPGSGWAFETRHLYELPAGARVLALDATGVDTFAEWQSIAERRGGALHFTTRAAIGETPAAAEHYRTARLRTARLWTRTGRGICFLADAPGAVKNALLRAAGAVPCALGVLTHKPLADALRWGANLVIDPDADPPPGSAFAADDVHALEIAELAAELVHPDRGWSLTVGHYGRDTRSTNAFERVDVLAVLGAPRGDYGATVADAAAIGIDAAELAADRTRAETIQAVARARHLRRETPANPAPRVRLFLATDDDAPTGVELPGVAWTTILADRSHAPTLARIDAAREIAAWADRAGCLDVAALLAALTPHVVGPKVARRLARAEADRRGWPETREGEAHRLVYRADRTAWPVIDETPEPNEIEHLGAAWPIIGSNNSRGAMPPIPPATPAPPYHERPRGPQPGETPGERPASAATGAGPAPFDPPDEWEGGPPPAEYDGPALDAENDDEPTPGELAEWAKMRAAG